MNPKYLDVSPTDKNLNSKNFKKKETRKFPWNVLKMIVSGRKSKHR